MTYYNNRRSRRGNAYSSPVVALTGGAVLGGVGASVVTSVGGNTGGIAAFTGFFPAAGSIAGAGMVLGHTKKLTRHARKLY